MRRAGKYFSSFKTGMMMERAVEDIASGNYTSAEEEICVRIEMMKLVVGLGNPGEKYTNNRHNVGFLVIDALLDSIKKDEVRVIEWESKFDALITRVGEVLLVKPQKFMNRSGEVVAGLMNFYKIGLSDLVIVHDDLDIRLGEHKFTMGVGPKIHNGVNSVETTLGRKDFWRLRIGVDNRLAGEARTPGEEYVLSDFRKDEAGMLGGVVKDAVNELISFLNED